LKWMLILAKDINNCRLLSLTNWFFYKGFDGHGNKAIPHRGNWHWLMARCWVLKVRARTDRRRQSVLGATCIHPFLEGRRRNLATLRHKVKLVKSLQKSAGIDQKTLIYKGFKASREVLTSLTGRDTSVS